MGTLVVGVMVGLALAVVDDRFDTGLVTKINELIDKVVELVR